MNINAISGHKVKYIGCTDAQVRYGNHNDPRGILDIDKIYEVRETEIHSTYTRVFLKGYENNVFNSVCFEDAENADR